MFKKAKTIKMRCILFFAILLIWAQNVMPKEVFYQNPIKTLTPIENVKDLRGIKEIWDNIRNSAKIAWTAVKYIAHNTKEKINVWINNLKDRADEIAKEFEAKLKIFKDKSKAILEKILGTGQLVKECLKKDKEVIDKIMKQILNQFNSCISENILKLSQLQGPHISFDLNDNKFLEKVENKLNQCTKDEINNTEECMHAVRKEVFVELENEENIILTRRMESRSAADDILDAIISCSVNGLIDSSTVIGNETMEIIKCVLEDGLLSKSFF